MARVAGHVDLAGHPITNKVLYGTLALVWKLGVDFGGKGDHRPRGALLALVVTGEITHHMTKKAVLAKTGSETEHGGLEVFLFQDLEILGRFGKWVRPSAILLLSGKRENEN